MTSKPEVDGSLVERGEELARIDALLAAARDGSGATLLVEGPAGIGKTRLVASARERAAQGGMAVLHGRGAPLERDFAMGLARQVLEPAVRGSHDVDALFAGAARLGRGVILDAPDSSGAAPFGVVHGLYWLTANLAERVPLLVAIDDAQWADEPSLRFLAYLAHRAESLSLALVFAIRAREESGAIAEILSQIRADPAAGVVHPRPLGVAGVQAVLRGFGGGAVDEGFARACHVATGGNPFLVSELATALRSEGVAFEAAQAGRVGWFASPVVAQRVRAALAGLGPEATELARAVVVLGDGVTLDLAAELASVPLSAASELSSRLARAGVLEDASPLRFLHPLLASAVWSDMSASERGARHARGATLLRARGASAERIALQLMHAPPAGDDEVVSDLREAARRAWARGAPDTAVGLLDRSLAEPPPAHGRAEVLLELGEAQYAVGRAAQAAAHFDEARHCAVDPTVRGRALVGLFQARAGSFAEQRALAPLFERTVPDLLEHDRELGLRLWALELLATEPGDEWERATRGLEDLAGETPGEAILLGHATLPIVNPNATAAGVAATTARIARHADALFDEGATALVMTGMVLGLCWAERLDAAGELLERAIATARRRGAVAELALAHQFRAGVQGRAGRLHDAEADARTALAISGGGGWAGSGAAAIAALIGALLEQGRVGEAAQELDAAHPQEDVVDSPAMTQLLLERMRLRAARGEHRRALADWDEALRRAERHFSRLNPSWVPDLLAAAEIHHALGETASRDSLLSQAQELAARWGAEGLVGQVTHVHARLAAGEHALDELREAVEHLRHSPLRLELARALVSLGEALRRAGSRVESREPLREGYELARACEAQRLTERARAELRVSGVRLRREALTGAESLTASERRIAELAAAGARNAEMAQDLFLTVKTVEMHLTHAYRKLDIAGRSELAQALAPES